MELSGIELQGSLSTATLESSSHITQFNEQRDVIFVHHSNAVETTNTVVTSIISNSTVTDNAAIADASGSMIKANMFSIKKYSSHLCLVFVILIVIAIVLVPIILYYTISPQEGSFLNDVDFKNCSVSIYTYIYI